MEPTYREHQLLKKIKKSGGFIITTETEPLETHWELVRAGYLHNLCLLPSGWRFNLTDTAREYLSSFKKSAGEIKT